MRIPLALPLTGLALLTGVPPSPASPAEAPPPPGVDPQKVKTAITRGCDWLCKDLAKKMAPYNWANEGNQSNNVLILYTLVKAGGAQRTRPEFQEVLDSVLNRAPETTYQAAVTAIALEALDGVKYSSYIKNCAQLLIDNQCDNGQWDYGKTVELPKANVVNTPDVAADPARKGNTTVKTSLTRRGRGRPDGDNSNTQYALLGLRSCEESGFKIPFDTWRKALAWWQTTQQADGGWNYAPRVANEGSYLGMTEGGLGSIVICMHYLQQPWKTSECVLKACGFIGAKFSCTDNQAGRHNNERIFQYYHLFAFERAGMLTGREDFGAHKWYVEGGNYLLEQQKADGCWTSDFAFRNNVQDTCFAILFLRRATRPVVYSGK
jgi:hypothetical protein